VQTLQCISLYCAGAFWRRLGMRVIWAMCGHVLLVSFGPESLH
jgi:hypothetical protein